MKTLEWRRAAPGLEEPLAEFFAALAAQGDDARFHPHALDAETAAAICAHEGDDAYYVLVADGEVLAYGLLRGWDEGFAVPSLGIAVLPRERGTGLGRLVMALLHEHARRRGSDAVRLKVYPDNTAAAELYRSLGYVFAADAADDGQLVGTLSL